MGVLFATPGYVFSQNAFGESGKEGVVRGKEGVCFLACFGCDMNRGSGILFFAIPTLLGFLMGGGPVFGASCRVSAFISLVRGFWGETPCFSVEVWVFHLFFFWCLYPLISCLFLWNLFVPLIMMRLEWAKKRSGRTMRGKGRGVSDLPFW